MAGHTIHACVSAVDTIQTMSTRFAASSELFSNFPPTILLRSACHADSTSAWQSLDVLLGRIAEVERRLEADLAIGRLDGLSAYSSAAGRQVNFLQALGENSVNWREGLNCPISGLNNRCRAAIDILQWSCGLTPAARLYVTEQTTPTYRWLADRYPRIVGSEYLGTSVSHGQVIDGVRHEDITALSFADSTLDIVASFDCLEHIPDYRMALREMARVLAPGGSALLTFPFNGQFETLVRASLDSQGRVIHHEAPEYHGDPVGHGEGILCYYHFGHDILTTAISSGFDQAEVLWFWSAARGNLGALQPYFVFRISR